MTGESWSTEALSREREVRNDDKFRVEQPPTPTTRGERGTILDTARPRRFSQTEAANAEASLTARIILVKTRVCEMAAGGLGRPQMKDVGAVTRFFGRLPTKPYAWTPMTTLPK